MYASCPFGLGQSNNPAYLQGTKNGPLSRGPCEDDCNPTTCIAAAGNIPGVGNIPAGADNSIPEVADNRPEVEPHRPAEGVHNRGQPATRPLRLPGRRLRRPNLLLPPGLAQDPAHTQARSVAGQRRHLPKTAIRTNPSPLFSFACPLSSNRVRSLQVATHAQGREVYKHQLPMSQGFRVP